MNKHGQLGLGDVGNSSTPKPITSLQEVIVYNVRSINMFIFSMLISRWAVELIIQQLF